MYYNCMTYALCGFLNFGSLHVMIGGLKSIAPDRRDEILLLGFKSIISATIATLMTGAFTGMILKRDHETHEIHEIHERKIISAIIPLS